MHKICNIHIRVTLNFFCYRDQHASYFLFAGHKNERSPFKQVFVNASFVVYICCRAKTSFDSEMKCVTSTLNPWNGIRKDNKNRKVVRCNNCGNNVNHISTVLYGLFPICCFCSVLLNSEIIS